MRHLFQLGLAFLATAGLAAGATDVRFAPFRDPGPEWVPPWEVVPFEGDAWVVLADKFQSHGRVPWWSFLSLANVEPVRTDILLEGSVFEVLAGKGDPGDRFRMRERWNQKGRAPYPADHPVNHISGPLVPGLVVPMVLVQRGTTVEVLSAGVLPPEGRARAFLAAVESARETEGASGFFLAGANGDALTGETVQPEVAISRIEDLATRGYRFEATAWQGWYSVYPYEPSLAPDRTGDTAANARAIVRGAAEAGASELFLADPPLALSLDDLRPMIPALVSGEELPQVSTLWFLGQTWLVIAQPFEQ